MSAAVGSITKDAIGSFGDEGDTLAAMEAEAIQLAQMPDDEDDVNVSERIPVDERPRAESSDSESTSSESESTSVGDSSRSDESDCESSDGEHDDTNNKTNDGLNIAIAGLSALSLDPRVQGPETDDVEPLMKVVSTRQLPKED